jgi:dolichyl-phosphate beta-glucosyltransferase
MEMAAAIASIGLREGVQQQSSSSKKTTMAAPISIQYQTPLLSVIVPVFNGSIKLESTLQRLKTKIEQLDSVVAKLESLASSSKKRTTTFVNTSNGTVEKNIGSTRSSLLDERPNSYSSFRETLSSESSSTVNGNIVNDNGANAQKDGSFFFSHKPWYEIVVVNDGSRDNTRQVAEALSRADKRIRLISYSINMGKGYAVRQGVLHSRGKYVIFMDGDGEISSEALAEYLEKLDKADIIIGSKNHPSSMVSAPFTRKVLSKGFQFFVRSVLGLQVRDTQVGLKVGNGVYFRKIFSRVIVNRYAFDAEMLAIATLLGLRIAEMPVKIDLEKSFKKKEIIRMALDVLAVAFRLRIIKWYQKNMEEQRPYYKLLPFP